MITSTGIAGLILILANFLCSYKGFRDPVFFNTYKFEVDRVLQYKEYQRIFTSGFLHVGWMHLILNMVTLFAFSSLIEDNLGIVRFLVIYFSALLGGELLALLVHRKHGDYSSVGASGAVSGIIFAAIALFPGLELSLFGLIPLPGWLFGLAYMLYSIYGIRSQRDNIGHESHLGGALIGLMVAVAMEPAALGVNFLAILLLVVPAVIFIFVIIMTPQSLKIDNVYYKAHTTYFDVDDQYNEEKANRQKELDRLLDKIGRSGIQSLSKKEKERLDELSR